jgi:hypothetical protein
MHHLGWVVRVDEAMGNRLLREEEKDGKAKKKEKEKEKEKKF